MMLPCKGEQMKPADTATVNCPLSTVNCQLSTLTHKPMITKTFSEGSLTWGSSSNAYILDLILTETAINQTSNYSTVAYKLQLRSGPSNRFQNTVTSELTLGSATVGPVSENKYLNFNSTWTLLSGSVNVAHDRDGTKTLSFTAAITVPGTNEWAPPDMTITGSLELTAIPRASTASATDALVGGKTTIVISRKNPDFYHCVYYRCGSLSGYITDAVGTVGSSPVNFTDTVINFPIPVSFYGQMSGTSTTCTVTVRTGYGGKAVGTSSTSFTVSADPSKCAPALTAAVVDVSARTLAMTGDERILIRYRSTAQCTISATPRYSSTIESLTFNGQSVDETFELPNVQTADFVFRATDSRGITSVYLPQDLTVLPYIPLSMKATVRRTSPTGDEALLELSGRYYNGSFGVRDNALILTCKVGSELFELEATLDGNSYTASTTLTGLDYRSSHTLTVMANDALDTIIRDVTVGPGIPVFDWGEADFAFHVPVTAPSFNGIAAPYFQYRGGCADADAALEAGMYRLTSESQNTPVTNGVLLVFSQGLDGSQPVAQLALRYDAAERYLRTIWYTTPYTWQAI